MAGVNAIGILAGHPLVRQPLEMFSGPRPAYKKASGVTASIFRENKLLTLLKDSAVALLWPGHDKDRGSRTTA